MRNMYTIVNNDDMIELYNNIFLKINNSSRTKLITIYLFLLSFKMLFNCKLIKPRTNYKSPQFLSFYNVLLSDHYLPRYYYRNNLSVN